jgi:hypothetical protein
MCVIIVAISPSSFCVLRINNQNNLFSLGTITYTYERHYKIQIALKTLSWGECRKNRVIRWVSRLMMMMKMAVELSPLIGAKNYLKIFIWSVISVPAF